jgi:hypothetical protein
MGFYGPLLLGFDKRLYKCLVGPNESINGLEQCQMGFYGPTNDFCVIIGPQNSPVSPLIGGQCQTGPLWAGKWLVGPLMGHKENAMGH